MTLLIMLALKCHYSLATADQLIWILAPTARSVAWLTPAHLMYETGVGYVDFSQGIIVAPACAGINFMIMAYGLAAFCGLRRLQQTNTLWIWLVISLGGVFGYTLLVNALRIGLSLVLYQSDIYGLWATPERLHRITGVLLYLVALWLLYGICCSGANRIQSDANPSKRVSVAPLPSTIPVLWYLLGTVGMPMLHLFLRQQTFTFGEHYITILVAAGCFWGTTHIFGFMVPSAYRSQKDVKLWNSHKRSDDGE